MTSKDLKVIDAILEKNDRYNVEAFLRQPTVDLGNDAPTSLLQLCDFCESIIAMPIHDDGDRRLILDAAYTLTLCFFVLGALSKSKALCRLLIHGNRALPGRPQELKKTLALMDKLSKTNLYEKYPSKQAAGSTDDLFDSASDDETVVNTRAALNPLPIEEKAYPSYSLKSMTPAPESHKGMKSYGPARTQTNDPSITRALFGSLKRIAPAPTQDTTNSINYIADFRNPSHPLSPHYTPFVTVPVPMRVFEDEAPSTPVYSVQNGTPPATTSKLHLLKRARSAVTSLGYPAKTEPYRFVRMSRDEYTRCWARDSNGNYLGTEAEGSGDEKMRRDWLANGSRAISQLEYVGHITEGREPFGKK